MELTQDDLASVDAGYWATIYNKIRLQVGHYSYEGREYLKEILCSKFPRKCSMKGAQGGLSTTELLKSFHGMIYKDAPRGYPKGVLYLFPTSDDMHEYSKGIIGPLIHSNHCLRKYVKNIKGSSDTDALKSVNGANLYMRGAGLTTIIEGEAFSTKLQGISCDRVVFDEIEQIDKMAIEKAIARMHDSKVKEEIYIGNPGLPGRGIDEIYHGSEGEEGVRGSDQRHWFRKCQHCGEWTCAELSFPGCVKIRKDGTGYVGCNKCGREIFVRDGQWVPAERENSDYMHGYQYSCLTSPNNDPAVILEKYINPPHNNLADVCRLSLGMAYANEEEKLKLSQVRSCCGPFLMSYEDKGPCAFGLDVGHVNRLIIGKKVGKDVYELIKLIRTSDWGEIGYLVDKFNCKSGVIDVRPEENTSRQFMKEHKHILIYLCEYSETTPIEPTYNKKTKIVKTNRTEICDNTHELIAKQKVFIPRWEVPEVQIFAQEVCNPSKREEQNKRTKQLIYRYVGTVDHYRHALNYFLLAAQKIGRADRYSRNKRKHDRVMNEYARI